MSVLTQIDKFLENLFHHPLQEKVLLRLNQGIRNSEDIVQRLDNVTLTLFQMEKDLATLKMSTKVVQETLHLIDEALPKPSDNDIEKSEPLDIDLNDEMRMPITSGMKVKYENEDDDQATELKIYK